MAEYLTETGLAYFWSRIKTIFVQKDGNKVLSTNDFTDAYKDKLDGISAGAEVNTISTISVNNTNVAPVNKNVNISVPTTVAELSDSGDYALKSEIVGLYNYRGSAATAADLPSSGMVTGDVYNIEAASIYGAAGANVAWVANTQETGGGHWDTLGETFSIENITTGEIDVIVAS